MVALVLIAGGTLISACLVVLAWAAAFCGATEDRMREQLRRERQQ